MTNKRIKNIFKPILISLFILVTNISFGQNQKIKLE
jgi:hypothetical protein